MQNPYKLIRNLSSNKLSSREIKILNLGLKHGVATSPVKSEVIMEDMWDQIKSKCYQK